MLKLFNNHLYIIDNLHKKDVNDFLTIAKKYNLPISYPKMFEEDFESLSSICIDDSHVGGHLMAMIRCYESTILRNKRFRGAKNFKELKEYIDIAERRVEYSFLTLKKREEYFKYVDSLDDTSLKSEYRLVKNLVPYIDNYCLKVKNTIENDILSGIKEDLLKEELTQEDLYIHLNKLVDLRNDIDDFINIDIYLFGLNKDDYVIDDLLNLSKEEIKRFLKETYEQFTYCDSNRLETLNTICENADLIFNLFNYKLRAEEIISLQNDVFDTLRQLGYYASVPNDLIGEKINDKWNYKSILEKLLYTLQLIDYYPITSNSLIQIKIDKSWKEVAQFAKLLISLGYKDTDDLERVRDMFFSPFGILIDTDCKSFTSCSSGTIMACMCSANRRNPLTIDDFIEHYEKIIINHDFVYHNLLYKDLGYHYDSSLDEICKQAEGRCKH